MKKPAWYTAALAGAAVVIIVIMILFTPNRCGIAEPVTVEIPKGSSVFEIADILDSRRVISWKSSFVAKTVITGKKSKLKYGIFEFSPGASYGDVLDILCNEGAKRETVSVTIPEGYSVEMITEKLISAGLASEAEFEAALNADYDFDFLKSYTPGDGVKYRLQGFLFPSTYEFYADASAEEIIRTMLAEFEKQYDAVGGGYDNIGEIITKASLIEREAKLDSERATIAGVIENRIKSGMKLQIDATVVYAITDGMYDAERVYYKDLEVDSPYNTYKYEGLPAGAICSPGMKSIEAALNPQQHDWLYYRTDSEKNDGSHTFSRTFEEHKSK